ncbi:CotH kinase family protein [Pseudoalteromonas sp. MMG010]|uniref:CotH kinase family protein n=1 Tax=Pseudoalteromonas sp. MMG010 TaxID=2822685 RepID=UPI001B3A1945|nr:CotH kinase family protein [Pseudoalteromonas sp. MMG010]MBQ4832063.1 CotH kinase family protein [Pseudoalteromonas sp. MMG010]
MKYNAIYLSLLLTGSLLVGCSGTEETSDTSSTDSTESTDTTQTASSLVINEVVAAAQDDGNDWIELYALEDIDSLATYSVVDDSAEREPQYLPDIALSAGEFIVIQAIDEADAPLDDGYYVTFKLGSDDAVTLFNDDEQVDQLDWEEGDAPEGSSYGLYTDGTGTAQTLTPTQGTANEPLSDDSTINLDTITNNDAAVRINEVVAANAQGDYDWIEFYVTGTTDVNLSDYSVADEDGVRVTLPDVTLSPGEYYSVYATSDEVSDIETVNFKLGASDEVSLYQADDLIDYLQWSKGQALYGFSFGRFPDGSDATKVLSPTALTANVEATHGPLIISEVVADDIDEGADWFELYNNSDDNVTLTDYTIIDESDDIDPASLPDVTLAPGEYLVVYAIDEETSGYSVPFKLGKEDELSLILNNETVDYISWDESDVIAGFSYGVSDLSNAQSSWETDFLTPTQGSENSIANAFTPTEVTNIYITISDDNWNDILDNPLDEEYHEASITYNGVTLDSVAIRTKGNSSLSTVANSSSDRYSFKIDINEYVDGQKFFNLKKFTLNNSYNDPSYMREAIAYDLLTEMGVAAPQHAYVNFYVNDELFGFYLMVESIDGEFVENNFTNANGDLYKPDGTGSDLVWIDDDITSYSDANLKTNEDTSDNGAFINFVEQINDGSNDFTDVDSLLRYLSVSVALSNLDSYQGTLAHNYYIYDQDGVFTLLPWDFNESFGTFSMGCSNNSDIRELYIDEPTSGALDERPLIASALANQDNLTSYHEYLTTLIEGSLSSEQFSERVNELKALISEHVANDPSAFYSYSQFEQNLTSTVSGFYGLTDFIDYRVENITQQLNGQLPTAGNGNGFCN